MKLYLVFYTDKFIPDGSRGCAKGPFIFIRPQCKEDEGLLAHEKEHVRQFWANPILHGLQYKFQWKYRLRCEIAAYQQQLKYVQAGDKDRYRTHYAEMVATRYKIPVTAEYVERLLRGNADIWESDL